MLCHVTMREQGRVPHEDITEEEEEKSSSESNPELDLNEDPYPHQIPKKSRTTEDAEIILYEYTTCLSQITSIKLPVGSQRDGTCTNSKSTTLKSFLMLIKTRHWLLKIEDISFPLVCADFFPHMYFFCFMFTSIPIFLRVCIFLHVCIPLYVFSSMYVSFCMSLLCICLFICISPYVL